MYATHVPYLYDVVVALGAKLAIRYRQEVLKHRHLRSNFCCSKE